MGVTMEICHLFKWGKNVFNRYHFKEKILPYWIWKEIVNVLLIVVLAVRTYVEIYPRIF